MTAENYIAIVIGAIALMCGPIVIIFREKIYRVIADTNRALGGGVGRAAARRSSPVWIGIWGGALMFIGVGGILVGIFSRG
ncbi:hypothetical protein ACIPY5_14900 [Microbacterium sp. NPDC089698]|uniref:hypothetical protein n=1 Tax=Microbacterium sp. NPDC089698 TaxID=3364200 RepID=UPI0037FED029